MRPSGWSRSPTHWAVDVEHNDLVAKLEHHLRGLERVTWTNIELAGTSGRLVRPDLFSMRRTLRLKTARPWAHEIKVHRSDFLGDVRRGKWRDYMGFCCRFWFVCPEGLINRHEVPAHAGLIWYLAGTVSVQGNVPGSWRELKRPQYCRGWTLPERALLKLILGRWGTSPAHR